MKNEGFSDLGNNPYFLEDTYANKNFSIFSDFYFSSIYNFGLYDCPEKAGSNHSRQL